MNFVLRITLALAALLVTIAGPAAAGVSISVGEPGFYGQIDIGNYPPPRLIYPEPIVVERVGPRYPPIYLRVPPGHIKHWNRHCREYGACGRPVYFIEDRWYNEVYIPHYREHYHHDRGRHHDRDYDRDDRGRGHYR